MNQQRSYVLDANAIALVGAAGRALALDPSSIGRSFSSLPAARLFEPGDGEAVDEDAEQTADVAVVRITGPLAQRAEYDLCAYVDGYDAIAARFADATASARSVVLVIDSPGGDGAGLAEAVRRMREIADAAGTPVLAYVDEFAASAAYWIAMGVADEVYLPAMGSVGSIGAIAVHVDASGAAEKDGLKYTIVRDPVGKAVSSSLEPLGDVGRARIERGVQALANAFVAAVAERRGLAAAAVRATNADMFMGGDAVRAGLADGVETLEGVLTRAKRAADERDESMKLKEAVGHLVKAPASASDEQMAASASAAAPIMNLGRFALSLAETSDPTEAMRTIANWKAHADAVQAAAPKKAQKKAAKRVTLLREAVVVGLTTTKGLKIDPCADISLENTRAHWLEMPLKALEGMIEERRALLGANADAGTPRRPDPKSPDALPAADLTAEEREYAARFNIDPKELAAHKAASWKAN